MILNPANADYSYGDAASEILRNLSYASFGTLMGVLSYGEVAAAI
jgi:hypothetical protein